MHLKSTIGERPSSAAASLESDVAEETFRGADAGGCCCAPRTGALRQGGALSCYRHAVPEVRRLSPLNLLKAAKCFFLCGQRCKQVPNCQSKRFRFLRRTLIIRNALHSTALAISGPVARPGKCI